MALKTYKKEGMLFVELNIACPVCYEETDQMGPTSRWMHNACGGSIALGENAYYECSHHDAYEHVGKWAYSCPSPNHPVDSRGNRFVKASSIIFTHQISVAGQMVETGGTEWLIKVLQNLGDF